MSPTVTSTAARTVRGRGLGLAPKILGTVALLAMLSAGLAVSSGFMLSQQTAETEKLVGYGDRGILLGRTNAVFLGSVRAVESLPLELPAADRRHWENATR